MYALFSSGGADEIYFYWVDYDKGNEQSMVLQQLITAFVSVLLYFNVIQAWVYAMYTRALTAFFTSFVT